ncbi:MAG: sigma-E factor negative regulatory protein [Steroidobacteraceae bacterium]
MNDTERDSQLSAMFDGELPAGECELLARRLARDPQLKQQWGRYALIGAAMRAEPLAARRVAGGSLQGSVALRVAAVIAADGAGLAEGDGAASPTASPASARAGRWLRPFAGLGIAAGVAALSLAWLQRGAQAPQPVVAANPQAPGVAAEVIAPPAVAARPSEVVVAGAARVARNESAQAPREPLSYVVPLPGQGGALGASAQLANYVVAHSEFSAPLTRRSLLSTLMAAEAAQAEAAQADAAQRQAAQASGQVPDDARPAAADGDGAAAAGVNGTGR